MIYNKCFLSLAAILTMNAYAGCKISEDGIRLVKEFELFMPKPYKDIGGGKLTIGYGYQKHVKPYWVWTEKQADTQLRKDLNIIAKKICSNSIRKLSSNELGALTSLAYNIGINGLLRSKLFKTLDSKRFMLYNKIKGKKSKGLIRRRIKEIELFNK